MSLLAEWSYEEIRSVITLIGTVAASILAAVAAVLAEWNRRRTAEVKTDVKAVKTEVQEVNAKTDAQSDELVLQTDLMKGDADARAAQSPIRLAKKASALHPKKRPVDPGEPKTEI